MARSPSDAQFASPPKQRRRATPRPAGDLLGRRTSGSEGIIVMRMPSAVNRDTVRAVPVWKALRGLGRVIRTDLPAYELSKVVDDICEYWSYSRHSDPISNVGNLLLYYNALPSCAGGLLTALTLALLLPLSWVEGIHSAGSIVTLLTAPAVMLLLCTWPVQRCVFLDKARDCRISAYRHLDS